MLVTGGAGFIGSHTCEALLHAGHRVVCLDNFEPFYDPVEKRANLATCLKHPDFELIEADIRDAAALVKLIRARQISCVIHLAAKAGVRPSIEQPLLYEEVNVRGTLSVLEAMRESGIRRLIFGSSSSVYGDRTQVPFRETDSTDTPASPYGATKKAAELLCSTYHQLYGFHICCLRFFTVYGPRQRPDLAIRKFVSLALERKSIPVFGDGSSSRDYTHVRDIVGGTLGALQWISADEPRFGIYNLGSNRPIKLRDLISKIEHALDMPLTCNWLYPQPGDVLRTFADTTRAGCDLGFRNSTDFDRGLADFVKWMRGRLKT